MKEMKVSGFLAILRRIVKSSVSDHGVIRVHLAETALDPLTGAAVKKGLIPIRVVKKNYLPDWRYAAHVLNLNEELARQIIYASKRPFPKDEQIQKLRKRICIALKVMWDPSHFPSVRINQEPIGKLFPVSYSPAHWS